MTIHPVLATTGLQAHYTVVLLFLLFGIFFGGLALGIAWLVRPKNPYPEKRIPYECGELPRGSAWVRFNFRFYLIALFFIVFDVEVMFLYPWAVVFRHLAPALGTFVFTEMALFIGILAIGLAYVWAKGDLEWFKSLHPANGETEVGGA